MLVRIADAADPRLAVYRDLAHGASARRDGLFVAEGRLLVGRLLRDARFRTRSVLVTRAGLAALEGDAAGVPLHLVDEATMHAVVGFAFHGGCVALGERGGGVDAEMLLACRRLVVLERVANPDNVGAVFRNAAAFGVDGVLLSPGSGDPLYRRALRVSMGGALRVPFATLSDWPGGLGRLRAAGFTVVALTPDAATDVATLRGLRRPALVLGTEGDGLGPAARAACDLEVAIRMAPGDHSLNVATACGIALHRLVATGEEPSMAKAIWNGAVLAESDACVTVEGNAYFPPGAVQRTYLRPSTTHTTCPWKGVASYYDVVVDGQVNRDAAWYYPEPKEAAAEIRGRIAFWRGVRVES